MLLTDLFKARAKRKRLVARMASFEQTGDMTALIEAVQVGRELIASVPPDHPDRGAFLFLTGINLKRLSDRSGEPSLLVERIQVSREAAAALAGGEIHASALTILGGALLAMFETTGDPEQLAEAVQVCREACAATLPDDPDLGASLTSLGLVLRMSYEHIAGSGEDILAEAVQVSREAVQVSPADHPERGLYLSNLGLALRASGERTGDEDTLAEAVQVTRDALAVTPAGHPWHAKYLANLGMALLRLYERTTDADFLAEAIQVTQDAVLRTPADHPERDIDLGVLAPALLQMFMRTQDPTLLAKAIDTGRDAVMAVPPDHPRRAGHLHDLASALRTQGQETGDADILAEAVQVSREAVTTVPIGHPDSARYLSNLSSTLWELFGRNNDLDVLAEAVRAGRDATRVIPAGHPARANTLVTLGIALTTLYEQTADTHALAEARAALAEAAASVEARTLVRITAGEELGKAALTGGDAEAALSAFEDTIALMGRSTSRRLSRPDREHNLGEVAGLGAKAASAAVQAGRPERAVELLEQVRGVLLAEAMDARGDLRELHTREPGLAARFVRLRDEMEAADHSNVWGKPAETRIVGTGPAAQRIAEDRRRLAREWESLLGEIRLRPGFSGFLLPPPIEELRRQAADGPVVVVNVSRFRCDALILATGTAVRVVELRGITYDSVIEQANRFVVATNAAGSGPLRQRRANQQEIHAVLGWLWDEVAAPILQDLGLTGPPEQGQSWPRLWWCPVGEMTFLPLHAAGHHSHRPQTVLDRVISSYTPTIRALRYARDHASDSSPTQALIVALPDTPFAPALPGAHTEATLLARLLPGARTVTGAQATRDAVEAMLPEHSIVHLACHALSDWVTPAASRLLLHDHATNPFTVAAISRIRLSHAVLAYLSACSTTAGNQRLADEAMHITAAFQLAGYQHVIGTLWPINDAAAVRIAADFYTYLTEEGQAAPRTERAARALHHATRQLREDSTDSPDLWAAHIHAGI
ncbi:CHAT domain-containing tetratricopeptide repeat protein [Acrocarpospora macrocephala]|nr:CHAT domain-containing protein [Acrocarpospora macrocephala]